MDFHKKTQTRPPGATTYVQADKTAAPNRASRVPEYPAAPRRRHGRMPIPMHISSASHSPKVLCSAPALRKCSLPGTIFKPRHSPLAVCVLARRKTSNRFRHPICRSAGRTVFCIRPVLTRLHVEHLFYHSAARAYSSPRRPE